MKQPYICIRREEFDSDLWTSGEFSKAQAWLDLIQLARFTDGHMDLKGQYIELKRGQVGWSELALSKRWQWSRGKVSRFLKFLEKTMQRIVQQKSRTTTIITILFYNEIVQSGTTDDTTNDTTDSTTNDTTNGTQRNNINKKTKRNKKSNEYTHDFELFWKEYPKGTEKYKSFHEWKKLDIDIRREAYKAIVNQVKMKHLGDEEEYMPSARKWIHGKRWDEETKKNVNSGTLILSDIK